MSDRPHNDFFCLFQYRFGKEDTDTMHDRGCRRMCWEKYLWCDRNTGNQVIYTIFLFISF